MKLGFLNFACRLARAYVIDYLCVQGHVDLLFFWEMTNDISETVYNKKT